MSMFNGFLNSTIPADDKSDYGLHQVVPNKWPTWKGVICEMKGSVTFQSPYEFNLMGNMGDDTSVSASKDSVIMACLLYGGSVAGWRFNDKDYASALFVNLSFYHATVYNTKTTNATKIWGKKVRGIIENWMLDDDYRALIPQIELNDSNNSERGGYSAKYIAHPPVAAKPYDAEKDEESTDVIKSCLRHTFSIKDDDITDAGVRIIKEWIASSTGALACYLMVYFRLIDKTPRSFIQSSIREPFTKMMSVLNIKNVDIRDRETAVTTMQALVQKRAAQVIMMTLAIEESKTDAVNSIKQLYSLRLAYSAQQCLKVLMAAAKNGFSPKTILSALSHRENHKTCQKLLAAYLIYATPCEGCKTQNIHDSGSLETDERDRIVGKYSRLIETEFLSFTSVNKAVDLGSPLVGFDMERESVSSDDIRGRNMPSWFDKGGIDLGRALYREMKDQIDLGREGQSEFVRLHLLAKKKENENDGVKARPAERLQSEEIPLNRVRVQETEVGQINFFAPPK